MSPGDLMLLVTALTFFWACVLVLEGAVGANTITVALGVRVVSELGELERVPGTVDAVTKYLAGIDMDMLMLPAFSV